MKGKFSCVISQWWVKVHLRLIAMVLCECVFAFWLTALTIKSSLLTLSANVHAQNNLILHTVFYKPKNMQLK